MSTGQAIDAKRHLRRETTKGRGMLKNLIIKWAEAIYQNEMNKDHLTPVSIDREPRIDSERGINFSVYKANGGMVVETRFYDDVKDRNRRALYVINDEQDMGHEIAKIITIESLKQ